MPRSSIGHAANLAQRLASWLRKHAQNRWPILQVSFEPRQVGLHVVAAPQKLESIIQKTAAFSNVNAAACTAVEGR